MQVGWSILLIIHGILAVFLLGAVTHQAVGAAWPVTKKGSGFFQSVRGVDGMSYTNAVVVLFAVTFAMGTIIYPTYRVSVRTVLQEYRLVKPEGMFEMKEQCWRFHWRSCRSTGSFGVGRRKTIGWRARS
jgi:hypothetical protein